MTSEDEHVASDVFDIPNTVDTQIFALNSGQFRSTISHNSLCDDYLRKNIGEPLSYALAYVIIYRPEDAIEFISNFLIDWSRQKLTDHESNNILMQTPVNKEEEQDGKHLLNDRKEDREIVFESDKHLSSSYQDDSHINSHQDDAEEVLSSYFQEEKQQTHPTNTQQHIHTHDTASGFDDEMKSNQDNNRSHPCQDGNLSSFRYFSKLREKIIKCDES